jgi:hypothetical protein
MQTTYHCSQQDLYTVCYAGADALITFLPQFTALKPRYNAAFADSFRAAVVDAEKLPDAQARDSESESQRIFLELEAKKATDCWQKLKLYIADAFPVDTKPRLEEAGSKYYRSAADGNLEDLKNLLTSASNFITAHEDTLTANDNMPATFKDTMEACKTEVQEQFAAWFGRTQRDKIATEEKLSANNAIYKRLMNIFADGQQIFRKDEATKNLFIFDRVLDTVSHSVAGLKGLITDSVTNGPLADVVIATLNAFTPYNTTTDADGYYAINGIAAGNFTFTLEKQGYTTLTQPITITTGVKSTRNFSLTATTVPTPANPA